MAKEAVPDANVTLLAVIEAILALALAIEGKTTYPPVAVAALQQLDVLRHQLHKAMGSEAQPVRDKNSRLKLHDPKKETA